MTTFCANCGTATGSGKFCPKCGSPQGAAAASAGPSISQMPYAQPAVRRKSPVLKIVLIVVALFLAVVVAVAIKGYYVVKDAYQEVKQAKISPAERSQAGCDLLGKEKVAGILGTAVADTRGNEAGEAREYCNYLSPANVASASEDKEDNAEKPGDSKDKEPSFKDLAKTISKVTRNKPLLSVQVFRGDAAAAIIGLKTVSRFAGGGSASVPGPWDEAYFGPQDTTFIVRKGQNGLLLDLTQVEKKRDTGLALAKEMVVGL